VIWGIHHNINIMSEKLLECTSVVPRNSKTTNKPYMMATFRPVKVIGEKTVITGRNSGNVPFNPGKEPSVGDLFEGALVRLSTMPYQIEDNTVDSITVVAFADENPVQIANRLLTTQHGDVCVLVNGKPSIDFSAAADDDEQGADDEEAVIVKKGKKK
jgi:hypothetical protein